MNVIFCDISNLVIIFRYYGQWGFLYSALVTHSYSEGMIIEY